MKPVQVRFLEPYRAWGIGSDPVLSADEAQGLISLGVCELYDSPEVVAQQEQPEPIAVQEPSQPIAEDQEDDLSDEHDGEESGTPDQSAGSEEPTPRRKRRSRQSDSDRT